MSFGDVLRSAVGPAGTGIGAHPSGIGGDAYVIWSCDDSADKFYKLDPSDFSTLLSIASGTLSGGAGGNVDIALECDYGSDIIRERNTSDLSIIRTESSPGSAPMGIGGDSTTIWHCDSNTDRIYELSIVDFSSVRNAASPNTSPRGIGGDSATIWHVDDTVNTLYELSTSDFSVIRSVSAFSTLGGVGGDSATIWYCDYGTDRVYELDAANVVTLSGTISDEWGNTIRDADITISNGATYTTTTDENGAYSQLVNPDTYDIAASKSRSRFHDITELVSVTADTTKNITMPTDRIVGKAGKQKSKGMSIPGGIEL